MNRSMRNSYAAFLLTLPMVALSACSAARPALYPNDQYKAVGAARADTDISDCEAKANEYVKSGGHGAEMAKEGARNTAVGAAVGGAAGAARRRHLRRSRRGRRGLARPAARPLACWARCSVGRSAHPSPSRSTAISSRPACAIKDTKSSAAAATRQPENTDERRAAPRSVVPVLSHERRRRGRRLGPERARGGDRAGARGRAVLVVEAAARDRRRHAHAPS